MKQITIKLIVFICFYLFASNIIAQVTNAGCGVGSPLLNNRNFEPSACSQCETCNMPENMTMDEILNKYQAKDDTTRVFMKIRKSELTVRIKNGGNDSLVAPPEENLKAMVSHMDDYMNIEEMLKCVNVNCFFTSTILNNMNLSDINKALIEDGQTTITSDQLSTAIEWVRTHNMDSLAAAYFCKNTGLLFGRADDDDSPCVYLGPCDGSSLIDDEGLTLRENDLGYEMAELDLFSQQLQGLEMAGKFTANPSPDLQKMMSSINAGVDLFNGLPNMGMDLMTLSSMDLSTNISVQNDGKGVKVNDFCGDLGMNWNLNAGGMITRNVKGLPDEFDGISKGIGIGPAPVLKPCSRFSGGGFSNTPIKVVNWSWTEPNIIHIKPTIAVITTTAGPLYINLDFTIEINVRYKPDTIEYIERGMGYIKSNNHHAMNGLFNIFDGFNLEAFSSSNLVPDVDEANYKLPYIHAIMGNKKINDDRFMSPKLARELDFLKGAYNLFDNVKEISKRLDYEQDEFYYNFDGHSGKFIIEQDMSIYLMPHDNLIITPKLSQINGSNHLTSFTAQTPEGKLYEFGRSDGIGVDFMTQTNYVLPNYFTYPEVDTTYVRLGPAKLQETSLPFLGAIFCYPGALEYGATYENAFTIKDSPEYTSGWHLLKISSLITKDSIEFSYEIDTMSYFTNKNLTHEYPNFNTSGDEFIAQGEPAINNGLAQWFRDLVNLLDTVPTEWRFGRASFIYTATENSEVRHRLTKISGNSGEEVIFNYSDVTVDIVGKKYCESIHHKIDGNFNKGWEFSKDEDPPAPEGFGCLQYKEGGPSVSADGEFGFNLGPKREKTDYPFLEHTYLNYNIWTFPVPFPYKIMLKEIPHHEQMTEFGSIVQIKQLFCTEDIVTKEAKKFAAEKNRKFLKTIYEIGRDESRTPVLKVEYEGDNKLTEIPKRFSMQQDLWGYYNTNPSGSLLPRMKYKAVDGTIKEAIAGHYGFSNLDEHYDVTLGHTEAADLDKCKIGLVKALELETKGRYIYEYEPNSWPGESGFIAGAGMRVKSLLQNSGHLYGGSKLTTYEYEQPFIINRPIRIFADPYAFSDYDFTNPGQIEKMIKTTSQPMNNWMSCKNNYVGYNKVREKFKANGYVDHFFAKANLDTITNVRNHYEEAQYLFFGQSEEKYTNNYSILNDPVITNQEYLGLEDSIRTYNNDDVCVEKKLFKYHTVYTGCDAATQNKGERSEGCEKYALRIHQHQQNYPGPFANNRRFNIVFNYIAPFGGVVGQIIGYIRVLLDHVHPFRKIGRHTTYRLEDITQYSRKAYPIETETTRYFADNSSNKVTVSTSYEEYAGVGTLFRIGNNPIALPKQITTEYESSRTTVEKIYYPQNSDAVDLKMGTTGYDYLIDNKIFLPIRTETSVASTLISGSIKPLMSYSGRYHTHQSWSVRQGAWVLDGTYLAYSDGMPTQYKVATFPIPSATEYNPIYMVWASNRTLTSRTYEGRVESYTYTPVRELYTKTNPDGVVSENGYDTRGRISGISELNGRQITNYTYNFGTIPNKITTTKSFSDGTPTQVYLENFDGFGKSVYKKRNAIRLSETKYDAMFRPIYQFDIGSGSSYMSYESSPIGELLIVEDGLGNTTSYDYKGTDASVTNSFSETSVTDPNDGKLTTHKDGLGNLLQTESAEGAVTVYRYDAYLRLNTIVNPVSETFTYTYNAMDKVITSTVPTQAADNATWYDEKYRIAAYKDANGNKFVNTYDIHNKLLGTAQVDAGTSFPALGMMLANTANGHYTSGLKVLQHTFATGKSWLQKKEEQIFRPGSITALVKTTEALDFDDIGRVEEMKMTYPDASVDTKTAYNDANLVESIENIYHTVPSAIYTDKSETTFDDELRPWKTYFTSDLNSRRLISQIKYDDRDRMITKWLDEDELQEINYTYDYSSKLTAINAPLTTECLEGEEVCTYELEITKTTEGKYIANLASIDFGGSLVYPVFPAVNYIPTMAGNIAQHIRDGLNYFSLGGTVTYSVVNGKDVFTVMNTGAVQIVLRSSGPTYATFDFDHCCTLAPNGDGDGPQGPGSGPEPEGGSYDNVDLFAEEILYDGLNIDQITLYNACEASAFINKYTYNLDHMVKTVTNKIRKSDGTLISNAYSEGMTYDLAGNIQTMQRNAIVNHTTNAVAGIDDLTYISSGTASKLGRVLDGATGTNQPKGLKPAASTYAYDNAGNITTDAGKNIGIVYNPIHLPQRFTTTDGNIDVHYTYGGEKIYTVDKRSQPIPIGGHLPIQRWYVGALEIENGSLKVHHHPEGRITVDSISQDTTFEYTMQDHLGNTVVTFSDKNHNKNISPVEVSQRNYYYAFGLQIDGNWDKLSNPKNAYLYNGKELHDWNGLNWQDYGARWYMSEIGRWNSVDALADHPNQVDKSVYAYAWNDPIKMNDPDGNCPQCLVGFAVGFALDVATQMVFEGKSLNDVNYKSAAISGVAGAVSGGISSIAKVGRVATIGINASIDAGESVGKQMQTNGEISATQVASDVVMGGVGGNLKVVSDAKIKVKENKLDRAARIAKNDPTSSGRAANVTDAKRSLNNANNANNAAATEAGNVLQNSSDSFRSYFDGGNSGSSPGNGPTMARDNTAVAKPLDIKKN